MPAPAGEALSETSYVTVILRLVLDEGGGTLRYGEVVDVEGTSQGRFVEWDGIGPAVHAYLAACAPGGAPPGEPASSNT